MSYVVRATSGQGKIQAEFLEVGSRYIAGPGVFLAL